MELLLHILDVQVIDDAPPPEIKRDHHGNEESIIGHHRDRPEDHHGCDEYRVPQVHEEVLLLFRLVVNGVLEAVEGVVDLQEGGK